MRVRARVPVLTFFWLLPTICGFAETIVSSENLRLAGSTVVSLNQNRLVWPFHDGRFPLWVSERNQGRTDLNGDRVADDSVLHVHDLGTGVTTNLGVSRLGCEPVLFDKWLSFFLFEEWDDLNDDEDVVDEVLHVYDLDDQEISSLGLAGTFSDHNGGAAFHRCIWHLIGDEHWLAFSVAEWGQGEDLNGDSRRDGSVVHVYDLERGEPRNLGLAGGTVQLSGKWLVFRVDEESQRQTDFNGDGDAGDWVLHVHDLERGETKNLGLAGWAGISGDFLAVRVSEKSQGSTDLNGDGDVDDDVLHVYDLERGKATNLGLAGWWSLSEDFFVFSVHEESQGDTDLNGDGDSKDSVLHVYDIDRGETKNIGFANDFREISGNWLVFSVDEADQGKKDLNGDGDLDDSVVHVYDLVRGETRNLELSGESFDVSGTWLVFTVDESSQGERDLNGDGDADDRVLHLHDLEGGGTKNLGFAGAGSPQIAGKWLVFNVGERSQGETDFNGDGDLGNDQNHDGVVESEEQDHSLHVYDLESQEIARLAEASSSKWRVFDEWLVFGVVERSHHGRDLNDDEDADDEVLHVMDLVRLETCASNALVTGFTISHGKTPWEIRFEASASREVGRAGTVLYEWDFGDGAGGEGYAARHTYRCPGAYRVRLKVTDGRGCVARISENVTVEPSSELLPPWSSIGVGNAPVSGLPHFDDNGTGVRVSGAGAGMSGAADRFHFVYRKLEGDIRITARVVEVHDPSAGRHSSVGVTLRSGLDPGALHTSMALRGMRRPSFRWRRAPGHRVSAHGQGDVNGPPNVWVRVERRGSTFIGSVSTDGTTWTEVKQMEIEFPDTVYVGITASAGSEVETTCAQIADLEVVSSASRPTFLRGDCNGDGKVKGNTTDAVVLLRFAFLAGGIPPCLAACDAEADGTISISDAVRILRYGFLAQQQPDPPFPQCGTSELETDKILGCATAPAACDQ